MSDAPKLSVVKPESLKQLPSEELLGIIIQQQIFIQQLQQEIERLKGTQLSDSQTSSKPPSSNLLKKSEKPLANAAEETSKRQPGRRPGHPGKTRKSFGRVDRDQILRPESCHHCGSDSFVEQPIAVQQQQVARLVERPIEIVKSQRQSCQCSCCAQVVAAPWTEDVVPGQDLNTGLQTLLVWLGNYRHLSEEKQQELIWELGQVEIGLGTLQTTNSRMAAGVAQSVEPLREWAQKQSHPEVFPDNNQAERSLRLAVTKRKVCDGSCSFAKHALSALQR